MKELSIAEIDRRDPQYQALLENRGTIFNDPDWLDLFGSQLSLYGIFDPQKNLVGAFTLLHTRIKGLSYLKNPLTTPHNALIYRNDADSLFKRNSFDKSLHTSIADFLKKQHAGMIQFSLPPEVKDVQPYLWKGFKVSPSYTYQLNLSAADDQILAGFDPKLRSDITKAQKDGVTVERTADLESVRALVTGKSDPGLIKKIVHDFSQTGKSFAIAANKDGRMAAAGYCVFDSTTAYYILGGYDSDQKQRGAAGYALEGAILHAKSLGLKVFDFEGSMVPSIESFFRGFGGELTPKFTVHRAILPIELVLKFVKRSIY